MTKDEALKMAIEHIENGGTTTERKMVLDACKKALEIQKQEPLSDDEIMILLNGIEYSAAEVETTFDYEIRIARAIEKAHGIGERK